jgi:UDP-N-acetyl-D-mannosaminuronic acid dehydrogenase
MKVSVIGGCGHVGLPLGITLAKFDFDTTLIDIDTQKVQLVASCKMPFLEKNGEEELNSFYCPK